MTKRIGLICILTILSFCRDVSGNCLAVRDTVSEITIQSCRMIADPYQENDLVNPVDEMTGRYIEEHLKGSYDSDKERRVREIATNQKKVILDQYYGAVIHAEDGKIYFYKTKDNDICEALKKGEKIQKIIHTPCCDGDPGAPCLLGRRTYILKDLEK